ncbi:C/H/G cyclin [Aaosphaeria arxii CBS 175.79]|uniref:RNA polymerase II holoenzyme cyclin-like subunit n=1 Tax=Aaosphaeria arxii CBS 175.79 TaxID=1450172 RepID=A0A6A5Y1K1_9PLEO|nr:C/H/G cyclin [Aaosphaeria arxii CBS 175.79]KAF2018710.1 C/H/G cyclin [Aaosphaeria arxii CBS 175.79]
MASSYWESTQRKFWTFSKQQLNTERRKIEDSERNLVNMYPLPDRRLLSIYFYHQLSKMARPLGIRQQALATAQVYVRRFYTKVEIRRTNPALVLATSLYLACKMEECPQHIRMILAEARHCWGTSSSSSSSLSSLPHPRDALLLRLHSPHPDTSFSEVSKIGECEFTLISEMNSQLIIHHPYRSLAELQTQFQLTQEENALAWSIINDHYLTDLPLLHPPHVVAITALFLAVVLKPTQGGLQIHAASVSSALQTLGSMRSTGGGGGGGGGAGGGGSQNRVQKLVDWLAESSVDIEAVVECTQELISLYEIWENYSDKACKDSIAKFVKSRGLDK